MKSIALALTVLVSSGAFAGVEFFMPINRGLPIRTIFPTQNFAQPLILAKADVQALMFDHPGHGSVAKAPLCQTMLADKGANSEYTQLGMFEIVYKNGEVQLSQILSSGSDDLGQIEQKLDRIPEKKIDAYLRTLKTSRDRIDHVKLHLYFPSTGGYVSQIIRLE